MAHEIEKVNGRMEAITTLTPAWWDRNGEYMADRYLTSEEIWGTGEGQHGICGHEYELRPVYDENQNAIGDWRRVVRKDTGVTMGLGMKDGYQIVQPRKAFEWLDSLMQDGIMKYASAGVLRGGQKIWILGAVPEDDEPIPGETNKKYVLWLDQFDGAGSLQWFYCNTRVECANTARIALCEKDAQFKGIRHAGNMDEKIKAARAVLINARQAFRKYNADARKLVEARYTKEQALEFVHTLLPEPADKDAKRSVGVWNRKMEAIRTGMRHPSSKIGNMEGTFWQLVNAVSFAVDHGGLFRFKETGNSSKGDNRFLSLMTGDGATFKAEAFAIAMRLAGIESALAA